MGRFRFLILNSTNSRLKNLNWESVTKRRFFNSNSYAAEGWWSRHCENCCDCDLFSACNLLRRQLILFCRCLHTRKCGNGDQSSLLCWAVAPRSWSFSDVSSIVCKLVIVTDLGGCTTLPGPSLPYAGRVPRAGGEGVDGVWPSL